LSDRGAAHLYEGLFPRVGRQRQQETAGLLEGQKGLAIDDDGVGAAIEYPAQQSPL
jgi:hypothetical protein